MYERLDTVAISQVLRISLRSICVRLAVLLSCRVMHNAVSFSQTRFLFEACFFADGALKPLESISMQVRPAWVRDAQMQQGQLLSDGREVSLRHIAARPLG